MFLRTKTQSASKEEFRQSIKAKLATNQLTVDQALIEFGVFYARNDKETPTYEIAKVTEGMINLPYEMQLNILKRWGVL